MLRRAKAARVISDPAPTQVTNKYGRTVVQVITAALYHYNVVMFPGLSQRYTRSENFRIPDRIINSYTIRRLMGLCSLATFEPRNSVST